MSEQQDPPVEAGGAPPAAETDWQALYERMAAERAALAQQVLSAEQVRQQLAAYATDLNRTYFELRRRLQQMTALHDATLRIGALLDIDAVIQASVEALRRLVAPDAVHFALQEPSAYEIPARLTWIRAGRQSAVPSRRLQELVREVTVTGEAHVEKRARPRGGQVHWLVLPLWTQGRAIGGICLARQRERPFSPDEGKLVELCVAS